MLGSSSHEKISKIYSASWFCDSGHLQLGVAEEKNNKKDSVEFRITN